MAIELGVCPVCGADIDEHDPEDVENYERWKFSCGAEVLRMGGRLIDEDGCGGALIQALAKINAANDD